MVQQIIVSCKERVTDMAFKKTNVPGLEKVRIARFSVSLRMQFIRRNGLWRAYDTHVFLECIWYAIIARSRKKEVAVINPKNKSIQTKVIKKYFWIFIICILIWINSLIIACNSNRIYLYSTFHDTLLRRTITENEHFYITFSSLQHF